MDSVATLLSVLRRVQLFAPEQVDEIERELGPLYDNPLDLGEYLVEIEWLTAYQLRTLFEERWNELHIGPYTILDRLGEGGVSQVFKAWDTHKGRLVALKVLRQNLASQREAVRQFQRELETVTRLNHPNIIKTFDAQRDGVTHYFAMEFVEGMDLQQFVELSGPLPVEQAVDFIRQAAQGLQHAHQLGMVHRDIKPANLFLLHPPVQGKQLAALGGAAPKRGPEPIVKILDWGLARMMRGSGDTPTDLPTLPKVSDSLLAEKGMLIGTADYIAPEQARDATLVDTRADIYSLGCVLFYLLAGRPPFTASALMQKLLQHQEEPPPSIQQIRSDVPEDIAAALAKMLAKKPEERFQIPLLVVAALRRCLSLSANGDVLRPGSAFNLNRPSSSLNVSRPGSSLNVSRPSSSGEIRRPGGASGLSGVRPR